MKKKIFLMFSAVILLVTLTIVNVSAGMHISTDWNGTSPTITFTNGTDGVASYVHQNSFYEDQNCFSIYSRVSYSSWYQGIAGEMVDPYCIPVAINYTITYSNISTPSSKTLKYTASRTVSEFTWRIPYKSSGVATSINVHHKVNCNDNTNYNSSYSCVHVSQTCSYY